MWGERVTESATSRQVYNVTDAGPHPPQSPRPTPRGADGKPLLGAADGTGGYWAYPSSTVLMQAGANVQMNRDGVLARIADAPRVAPFQPWALGLYRHRQQRHLADDPGFLNCKNPGGVRQFQTPYGVQFVEDDARQRIFVLVGGGNRNYRIIYMDGREQQGQVQGDDDNPLYYGRAVAHWERRHARRRDHRLQRGLLVHERRLAAHEPAIAHRALFASRLRHAALRGHG